MSQIPLILRFPKWLSRTLKEEKERKKETAFNLWLACHTQEEIAEAVDMTQQTIADWMKDFTEKLTANNSVNFSDFDPPRENHGSALLKQGRNGVDFAVDFCR